LNDVLCTRIIESVLFCFRIFYKETVTKEYQNYKFRQPYHQAMYYCSLILQDQTWPWTEELDVLSHLEAEDVAKFVPMLLSRTFIECYIAGINILCLFIYFAWSFLAVMFSVLFYVFFFFRKLNTYIFHIR